MLKKVIKLNGVERTVIVNPEDSLAKVLREQCMLLGCKIGCGNGQCGVCSTIVNGKVLRACSRKIKSIDDGAEIETIEGLGTPDNLHPLQVAWIARGAAQCGFCSPGFILSAKQLLEENVSPSREDVRDWFQKHRNACRCTGYVPLVDAVMEAAKVMRGEMKKEDLLFQPTDNVIAGTYYHRPSALAKVTGTWDFGADLALKMPPDSLHLALVQADISHAKLVGIDSAEAEKMPGVFKVITAKDVKGNNRISGLITFPTNKGDGWDRPILCDEKIFQFGDAIAIVAALTPEIAREAAAKVKIEYEPLPAYMNAMDALADDAIEVHPGVPNKYFTIPSIKGEDTAPIMASADHVVELDAYTTRQPHLNLEPDCGQAYIDEEGRLTIHSKSIGLHLHHGMIQAGIGIEPEKLRLIQNPAGGTFGYKFSPTIESLLGVACLACDNRPVSLVYDMYQNITYTGKRSPLFANVKLAVDKDGMIQGVEGEHYIDHGPYSEFGDLLTLRLAQYQFAGYHVPNIRTNSHTVATNHAWGSAFRGYGAPEILFATELTMDVMAEKLGMDPFDFRYKNIYRPGSTTPTGSTPEVFSLVEMFDKLRPKYEDAKKRVEEKNKTVDPRYKHGVSVTLGIYGCGLDGPDSAEAIAEILPDGNFLIKDSWEDHGQGADIGTLTMAHQTLCKIGVTPEQIKLLKNDTAHTPNSGPAGGSRSNVMVGNAIRVACEDLVKALTRQDGSIRTYDDMISEKIETKYTGNWVATGCSNCDLETAQGNPFSTYMYQLFMPEVKVDTQTGKVEVEKFTSIADIGKITNKSVVDGQMYGGITQGIGFALSEDFDDLDKHTTLIGCGLPYIKDVPDGDDFEISYVETYREEGPYGASGCGEAPLTAPHPAIINAIYNACGVRITELPALPEKILAGLAKIK